MLVQVVTAAELDRASSKLAGQWPDSSGEFECWESYHNSLKTVAAKYGTVSWDSTALPDFYFSGDWFHENSDAFSIITPKVLSPELLRDFQKAVAAHHAQALLHLNGISDPIDGLDVLITRRKILVAWGKASPQRCQEKLWELGVALE